jgi:2-keto-3-deoxy-L-rhamnonate aldolase RhmA
MHASQSLLNPLAARLRAGELGLALMIKHARTVDIALAAKTCGFDAIYFDLQHSTIPEDAVTEVSSAAVQAGIASIVRIPERGYGTALRVIETKTTICGVRWAVRRRWVLASPWRSRKSRSLSSRATASN